MEPKSINPKSKQDQIPKELGYASSTSQRLKHDIKMQSAHISNARNANCRRSLHNPKRTQITSEDLKRSILRLLTLQIKLSVQMILKLLQTLQVTVALRINLLYIKFKGDGNI